MDQLQAIRVFVRIAEARSFAKAADSLDLPRSSVSKLLQDLEQHLGTKLVERSTRALTITPEGEAYRDQALSLLADLDEMDATAWNSRLSPRGRLRVDVGSSLANVVIIPALPDFRARYPDIELLLGVNDRPVDLIGEGVDCVIRGGALSDTSLIARRLCNLDSVTCATPIYLAVHGIPAHPSELETAHVAISYFFPQTGKSLPLHYIKGAETCEINARSAVSVSESTAHTEALLAGLGIGQTLRFSTHSHFEAGRLVPVFEDWTQPSHPLHLVYPATRHPSAKLRAFADWAVEIFGKKDRHAVSHSWQRADLRKRHRHLDETRSQFNADACTRSIRDRLWVQLITYAMDADVWRVARPMLHRLLRKQVDLLPCC